MEAYKLTFQKDEKSSKLPEIVGDSISNRHLPEDPEMRLLKYQNFDLGPEVSEDHFERILKSGVFKELDFPWEVMEVLKGKTYVKKETTVTYTIIKDGNEELASKISCDYMNGNAEFTQIGDLVKKNSSGNTEME